MNLIISKNLLSLTPRKLRHIRDLAYELNTIELISSDYKVHYQSFIQQCFRDPELSRNILAGERKRLREERQKYNDAYKAFMESDDKKGEDLLVWREAREHFKQFMADYRLMSYNYLIRAGLLKGLEKEKQAGRTPRKPGLIQLAQ